MSNYSNRVDGELLRLRWEKETRYYEAHIEQDLWGEWVFTRVWGRRNSLMGQMKRVPCVSYEEAARRLATVDKVVLRL